VAAIVSARLGGAAMTWHLLALLGVFAACAIGVASLARLGD